VTLREITTASRTELEALTVTPLQASYVESVAGSLAEAAATPDAAPWCRGVYAGDAPLGFVMISDGISPENMANPDYLGPYCLWRPLVDRAHQGRGHGAAARLVAEHLRADRPDAEVLLTSCGRGEGEPYGCYLRQGFRATGETHQGESVLALPSAAARSAGRPVPQRRASAGSLHRLDWRGGRLPSSGGPRRPREVSQPDG
jgi:diamine N-acetyltransferase